jgi:dihydrofolate reductase
MKESDIMQATAFIATTLDGYIARPDHSIDWLEDANSDATEDYGYEAFVKSVSCVVMGRKTFQKIMTFPEWPYQHHRVIVLSSTLDSIPEPLADQVQLYNGSVSDLVTLLEAEGDSHIYVDGSRVVQSFIKAGLLTDITLTQLPLLIGEGIPLFGGPLPKDIKLTHLATRAYQNGFVQTQYIFN